MNTPFGGINPQQNKLENAECFAESWNVIVLTTYLLSLQVLCLNFLYIVLYGQSVHIVQNCINSSVALLIIYKIQPDR